MPYSYPWQYCDDYDTDGHWVNIVNLSWASGEYTNPLQGKSPYVDYKYRCTITDAEGRPVTTNIVTFAPT